MAIANALAIQLVIKPTAGMTTSLGPREVMADVKTVLEGNGYVVYTDGADNKLVAIPANEANPSLFT